MVVLDITIVNIALPSAQDELGFDIASRPWVITAYSLAFGSLLLLGGRLSDRVGVRRTLIIGLIGFAAASALGGVATRDAGIASAMVNTSQQIGGTVGTAALSTIFTTALARYIDDHQPPTRAVAAVGAIHGYSVAFHIAAALFVAGAILTALILRSGRLPNDAIHV